MHPLRRLQRRLPELLAQPATTSGPAALLKAYRFVFDSRDDGADERLEIVNDKNGVWRCHTIFNCMEACPKKIKITEYLSRLKVKVVENSL